jgi:hypothetical protein
MAETVVPLRLAIDPKVSPFFTTYEVEAGFLGAFLAAVLDFVDVDFLATALDVDFFTEEELALDDLEEDLEETWGLGGGL